MKRPSLVMLFLFCFSCSSTRHNGSQFINHREKIENFDAYNHTKEDLINNFGYPTMELEFGTWLYYYYLTKVSTVLASTIDKEAILLVYFNKNDEIISHSFREKNNINRLSNIETERHENNTQGNLLQEIMKGLDVAPATR